MHVLSPREWRELRDAHEQAVHERTASHLERRSRGEKHPVEDFLFTYYPFKPGKLATWHPGAGTAVVVETSADEAYFNRRWYTRGQHAGHTVVHVDVHAWTADRGQGATFIRQLLEATVDREASFGCFGLHEWAMVYKQTAQEHRHSQVPLRLSQEETDRVVENHRIQCSHYDAFRFFTPPARPLNTLQPTRQGMRANEQPGCLHAGMDLYKWAMKLEPIVESGTVLDTFDLARAIRTLDMEASPYDVRAWGYGVVAIETAQGKAEYMRRQEEFSRQAQDLRRRLITQIDQALELI
ncbi:3-methyladenine DNA glycosylase [Brevibacterium paucivorans]|uniref:3-methyladenine DNA glycosylase n=1 Tax=Brevibacterium paucivorans TaxID=170994 RepID=A0A2N6VNJ8_9MICO|nr:3-methyladenine DNA glycosylase [Brevibacterium paucivorans]PMD05659.1 3-methyladenine DNA glycosylase [Brevibacterium paucivorans]